MFCSVTFIVFLFGVFGDATWGEELSDENVRDETLAKHWLQEFNYKFLNVFNYDRLDGQYNYSIDETEKNRNLSDEANARCEKYVQGACKNASRFNWKNFTHPNPEEWFALEAEVCPPSSKEESRNSTSNETTASPQKEPDLHTMMTSIYIHAEICKEGGGTASESGTCIKEIPGLMNLMANSRNWYDLLWGWKSWRDVTGKEMKKVLLQNNKTGCGHFGVPFANAFGMKNFSSVSEDLWQRVKPLYQQLHAYVRRKLMDSYPDNLKDFPSTRQIPAHILGNIWAQQWGNIYDLVVPFPNSTVVNFTKILEDQSYDVLRMYHEADSFFISLGLPAMTKEFWDRSVLEKPRDKQRIMSCQPQRFNFYNKRDYRIKMCTQLTDYYFQLIHHYMGYIQYYMGYKDLPYVPQEPAHPAFPDVIGDVIALSAMTPGHLRKMNLLEDSTDDHRSDMNFLIKIALETVAFLPYGYLLDKYRWEIANNSIPEENCNKKYWKLRCGMQGISPPVSRSEEDFDPGAKRHVPDNCRYILFFYSSIIQFQFHKSLCEAAGHVGPLHRCDIYKSTAAGDKLRYMMSLGNTRPWEDAMEIMTGQRNIDIGPFLEYFQPLHDWLKTENEGKDVGWDEECPVGSIQ